MISVKLGEAGAGASWLLDQAGCLGKLGAARASWVLLGQAGCWSCLLREPSSEQSRRKQQRCVSSSDCQRRGPAPAAPPTGQPLMPACRRAAQAAGGLWAPGCCTAASQGTTCTAVRPRSWTRRCPSRRVLRALPPSPIQPSPALLPLSVRGRALLVSGALQQQCGCHARALPLRCRLQRRRRGRCNLQPDPCPAPDVPPAGLRLVHDCVPSQRGRGLCRLRAAAAGVHGRRPAAAPAAGARSRPHGCASSRQPAGRTCLEPGAPWLPRRKSPALALPCSRSRCCRAGMPGDRPAWVPGGSAAEAGAAP